MMGLAITPYVGKRAPNGDVLVQRAPADVAKNAMDSLISEHPLVYLRIRRDIDQLEGQTRAFFSRELNEIKATGSVGFTVARRTVRQSQMESRMEYTRKVVHRHPTPIGLQHAMLILDKGWAVVEECEEPPPMPLYEPEPDEYTATVEPVEAPVAVDSPEPEPVKPAPKRTRKAPPKRKTTRKPRKQAASTDKG